MQSPFQRSIRLPELLCRKSVRDRHLLVSALGRQHFLRLPPSLRFVSHFGNDVLANTKLENYLRDRAYSVTSDTANCIIFDGGRLIHRGGLVQQGERWACQIVFVGEDNNYTNSLREGWRDWFKTTVEERET